MPGANEQLNHQDLSDVMASEPILIAQSEQQIFLLPKMANRHGLIAGATKPRLALMKNAFPVSKPYFTELTRVPVLSVLRPPSLKSYGGNDRLSFMCSNMDNQPFGYRSFCVHQGA